MAISLRNTRDVGSSGAKVLVYGAAGAGKTSLIRTAPNPIILSAEAGLLSLSDFDISFIEVSDMRTIQEAYAWILGSEEATRYETICLDSLSEIAEVVLSAEKKTSKDPRQAYGTMQDQMNELIRAFRDIQGKNVYFSAKLEKTQDETGRILYSPSMPGNKTGQALPYFFDEVLALRVEKDSEGNVTRALMTDTDGVWAAKDRSGKLDFWEELDLNRIFKKIRGEA